MFKYLINIILLIVFVNSYAQKEQIQEVTQDSVRYKNKYGLRVGIDISNPVRALINNNRKGLEIVGDYRLSKNWYIATELGYMNNITDLDNLNFTTKGQYIKVGTDYNVYENWLDMDNLVYVGFRYGFSTFSQTLNRGNIFGSGILPQETVNAPIEYNGLNAHWAEVVVGMKAEIFNNLFLGFSFRGKRMITTKEPTNFKNLFVPGYNRVFLNNSGFGFNYTISYLIPLYKRAK